MIPLANVLQPLIDVAEAVILFFHDEVGFGWGVSIIALTFATRLVILPLTLKGIRSMRALQVHQPKLKEIQDKYKDDRERMQRELMEFYRENKINPFSSCLPFLLQIPFFLALFYLLRSDQFSDDLHAPGSDPSFLFINALDEKATGVVLAVLIALYFVTFLASILMSSAQATGQQRYIMLALPVLFTPVVIAFPSGLIVYWITTNVWTIGQQAVVNKLIPAPTPASSEQTEGKPAKPPPPPPRKRKKRR